MLNRDEQADRIVTAWAGRDRARGFIFTDRTTAMDLALIALTALECGETHPDRPDVRCTQPPHDQGHLYHRNSDLNVEWWTSGDGVASTSHDVLGPIQLVQAPFTGAGETLAHRLSRSGMSGHVTVTEPRGRYHTLPPCEDDTELVAPPKCGAKHDQFCWSCDRDAHQVDPDEKSTWHHDSTQDRYWYLGEDVAVSVASGNDADRAVYRDLLPILASVATFLNDLGKRYREGNPRMTSATCRTAETHRDTLHDTAGKLRDLLDGTDS